MRLDLSNQAAWLGTNQARDLKLGKAYVPGFARLGMPISTGSFT